MFNLETSMPSKNSSAARKSKLYPGSIPEGEAWTPEKGADQFLYVDPDKIRTSIREKVEIYLRENKPVTAEETVGIASEGLASVCKKNKLEAPKNMFVTGGENDVRDFRLEFDIFGINTDINEDEQQRYNFYGVCDDAGHAFNRGAAMFNFNDTSSEAAFFLAQSEQFDQIAASRSNAAVIRAAFENAADPAESPEEIVNKAAKNVEDIAEEFGEQAKPVDLTAARLVPATKADTYELLMSNLGGNRCVIMNPSSGKVRVIPMDEKEQKIRVTRDEIVLLASAELFKGFESKKEPAEIQVGNRLFMEAQMGKPLKDIGDELIEECHNKGLDTSISLILFRVPPKTGFGHED